MRWAIDVIAVMGGVILAGGVFLQCGLPYSLMVAGFLLIAFATKAAKVQEDANVSNSE